MQAANPDLFWRDILQETTAAVDTNRGRALTLQVPESASSWHRCCATPQWQQPASRLTARLVLNRCADVLGVLGPGSQALQSNLAAELASLTRNELPRVRPLPVNPNTFKQPPLVCSHPLTHR